MDLFDTFFRYFTYQEVLSENMIIVLLHQKGERHMNNGKTIQSSLYQVIPIDFPQGDDYITDIELITMSVTGIIDAQIVNTTCNESCMMLINAIKLFQMGFFDCAFYSIRQTIELSISGIYLYTNKRKLIDWNKGEDGFEKGRMAQILKRDDASFSDVREKLDGFFHKLRDTERKIDKYVHKQGLATFYTYNGRTPNYHQRHKTQLVRDFEKYLKDCIGAVAVYRLIIDPLPLLLTDQDIAMRAPELITAPYGPSFIDKYLDNKVIEAYKQTDLYKGYYEELSTYEKQNDAVYDLIHWQLIDRKHFDEYERQAHLLSMHDKLALIIAFVSQKVSNFYLMNGFSWYYTETKSIRKNNSIALGNSYYEGLFSDERNYNLPFDNVFISRCSAFGETHFFEHNEPLSEQDILLIEQYASELDKKYNEINEQLQVWYMGQTNDQE